MGLIFLVDVDRDRQNDMCEGKLTRTLYRQSKLSQDELNQLQKDTHFDKKELQQWYKGVSMASILVQNGH